MQWRADRAEAAALVDGPFPACACAAVVLGLFALGVPAGGAARPMPAAVQRVLVGDFGFAPASLAAVESGQTVVRALDMPDNREVSAVGVVRVNVPASFYAAQLLDIVRFKSHEQVYQIGAFGEPARASDLAGLTLDRDDLHDLRKCTPDACDLHLSATAIADAGRAIAWNSPQATQQAEAWFRATLASTVAAYQRAGDRALMTYVGGDRALSTADEFRALVNSPPDILAGFPSVRAHLANYPRARAEVDDLVYWSKEKVGPFVVISATHLAIVELPPSASPVAYVGASRQIYGSRLYEASLGLSVMIQDPTSPSQMYLVYANRSRVDAIGGIFGPIKRGIVRPRARATLSTNLERARRDVERRLAQEGNGG